MMSAMIILKSENVVNHFSLIYNRITVASSHIPIIITGFITNLLSLGGFLGFLILYTVGSTPWTGDQPIVRPLFTHKATQMLNKVTETSTSRVEFEPRIPVFEWAMTVHVLHHEGTVIGSIVRVYITS
jgi:fatty acid desaturase